MEPTEKRITAYTVSNPDGYEIIPAPSNRQWMDDTDQNFAYRCLPLTIANQSGWFICSPSSFMVQWNGRHGKEDTLIIHSSDSKIQCASSHFGYGIITFQLPYLFVTSPDTNLWVKGPTNHPKDGIFPLEGIVETDWAASTFTMNWKITRPDVPIGFSKGEPICMIVPQIRGLAETMRPVTKDISTNSELAENYRSWNQSRSDFLKGLEERRKDAVSKKWEKDYYKGIDSTGNRFRSHQTQLELRPFSSETRTQESAPHS